MKGRAYVINSSHANNTKAIPAMARSYLEEDEKRQLVDTQTPAIIEDLEEFTPEATRLDTMPDLPPPPPKVLVRRQESLPLVSAGAKPTALFSNKVPEVSSIAC